MVNLWRACNLSSSSPCLTGPPDYSFASRHKGPRFKSPGAYLFETGILMLALSCYIGDPDVIDHCGLVWGGPCPEPSVGPRVGNVIIPLDLTQLSCPGFTLAAGLPSGFTTDGVGCWGGALWRACNLSSFSPCLTGPVDYLFASRHKGPGFKSPGGYWCETGILLLELSRYRSILNRELFLKNISRLGDTLHTIIFVTLSSICLVEIPGFDLQNGSMA
jgi:hypothetical protein